MPKTSVVMSRLLSRGHRPDAGPSSSVAGPGSLATRFRSVPVRRRPVARSAPARLQPCSPASPPCWSPSASSLAVGVRQSSGERRGRGGRVDAGGAAGIGDPYFPRGRQRRHRRPVLRHPRPLPVRRPRLRGWTRRHPAHHRAPELVRPRLPAARLGGAPVDRAGDVQPHRPPRAADHARGIRSPAGTTVRVTVQLRRPPRPATATGARATGRPTESEVEAVNEPHMAPWWFPANDHPLDKARMDIHITVPSSKQVVSQRPPRRRTPTRPARDVPLGRRRADGDVPRVLRGRPLRVRQGTAHHLPYYLAVSRHLRPGRRGAAMRGLRADPGDRGLAPAPGRPATRSRGPAAS